MTKSTPSKRVEFQVVSAVPELLEDKPIVLEEFASLEEAAVSLRARGYVVLGGDIWHERTEPGSVTGTRVRYAVLRRITP